MQNEWLNLFQVHQKTDFPLKKRINKLNTQYPWLNKETHH
jgi:hypothetical protein